MGSNTEKKPWNNLQNLYKNWKKGIKSDKGGAIEINEEFELTYPKSHFKEKKFKF